MTLFEYQFQLSGKSNCLKVDIPIPLPTTLTDFCERLSKAHQIPCFILPSLKEKLTTFVALEEQQFYSQRASSAIENLKNGKFSISSLSKQWGKAFIKQIKCDSKEPPSSNLDFSSLYKKLIHSTSLMSILNVEHAFAMAIQDVIWDRDRTIAELEKRQAEEMSEALSGGIGGRAFTDIQINNLAQRHFERLESESERWEKVLATLKRDQKVQYYEWLKSIDQDPQQSSERARSLSQRARSVLESKGVTGSKDSDREARLEESFTIHLGAQLKTTHNLRLMATDVLDLCRHAASFISGGAVGEPQRLQTALSLYSHKLCGLVLLVDDRLNSYSGIKKDFAEVCSQSTDFHFPELADQLMLIEQNIAEHSELKAKPSQSNSDSGSIKSGSSADSQEKKSRPRIGSFYVTKHSNLSEVHSVFHLVTDDTLLHNDINSRHSAILGLRNILKACFKYDITTLTIPLLLTLEMTEEMTIPWCMKRAELVFKCVKGFMMEMSTWADAESRTIQFMVPKGLSVDTFNMLSNMLPEIFRQSDPIVGS